MADDKARRLHRPRPARPATSSPSTTSPTRWVTSSAATTPSTAPPAAARRATATPRTSVEPGSGSSVMAYAGICAPERPAAAHRPVLLPAQPDRDQHPHQRRAHDDQRGPEFGLTGFDGTDSFTARLQRHAIPPRPSPTAANYTTAGIKAAIEAATRRHRHRRLYRSALTPTASRHLLRHPGGRTSSTRPCVTRRCRAFTGVGGDTVKGGAQHQRRHAHRHRQPQPDGHGARPTSPSRSGRRSR